MEHLKVFIKCVIVTAFCYLIVTYPAKKAPPTEAKPHKDKLLALFKKAEATKEVVADRKEEPKQAPVAAPEPPKAVEPVKSEPVPAPEPQPIVAAPKAPEPVVPSGSHQDWMRLAGIPVNDWPAVDFIVTHESSWIPSNVNPYGCIGLGQNCPTNGVYWLPVSCPNWQTDPVCQLKRFSVYAQERYGGWWGSMAAWKRQGWW